MFHRLKKMRKQKLPGRESRCQSHKKKNRTHIKVATVNRFTEFKETAVNFKKVVIVTIIASKSNYQKEKFFQKSDIMEFSIRFRQHIRTIHSNNTFKTNSCS